MKKIVLTMAMMVATSVYAEVMPDTTIVHNGHSVTITDGSLNISSTESRTNTYETQYYEWTISESFNLPLLDMMTGKKKKNMANKPHFESKITGFYVGFNKAIDSPSDMFDNDMGRSIELGFTFVEESKVISENVAFTAGFGLNWRNFKLTDDNWMHKCGGYVEMSEIPAKWELEYSKLRVFGFSLPMVVELQQKHGRGFHGYVGAAADFRLAKRVVNVYYDDQDVHHKNTRKHVRTLPVGCDVVAQVGYRDLAVYAKYSPVRLFEEGRGPIDKALTVGLKWCW
ncbi:MAG: hypothetical protein MJZ13_06610 [Bacteroidales bacterium]|nr:hypothetical protein [Bacteroidales bacterium]